MVQATVPKAVPGNYNSIAAQYARAKAIKDAEDAAKAKGDILELNRAGKPKSTMERLNDRKAGRFRREWNWVVGFFVWVL
jgi:phosphatidylinositol glycan class O